jgi:hypothetical protein
MDDARSIHEFGVAVKELRGSVHVTLDKRIEKPRSDLFILAPDSVLTPHGDQSLGAEYRPGKSGPRLRQ